MLKTPSQLNMPVFLLNFPLTVDNKVVNNPLMEKYAAEKFNYEVAFEQFTKLYRYLANKGLVYFLPNSGNFQDQTYVANLGCYLPSVENPTILLSNFKSEPRKGEDKVGLEFFKMMKYNVWQIVAYTFEGEADLKWLRGNVYVGGYGIRTQKDVYNYLNEYHGTQILPIEMCDEKLYHFDCSFLPLTATQALVATSAVKLDDLRELEKLVDIISVPKEYIYDAWTNGLVFGKRVLHMPNMAGDCGKKFSELMEKHGYEPVLIDLSEFEKSGAALSCMVMHLNYKNRM
jgi:N-dimethylarginine dimethylaminohydrolase